MRSLSLLILLFGSIVYGQKKDAHLWTGLGLDMDITKKISVDFETQSRFDQNASKLNQLYFELGSSYKVIKGVKLGFIYRYARKNSGDYFFNQNRFCLDLSYRYRLDFGITIKTRARYQHAFDRFSIVNEIYPNKKNLYRQSFKISYLNKDFKLISPFIGTEFFYALQPKNPYSSLDTYRLKAGFVLDLPKRHSVKVFYTFEHEHRSVDNLSHIYGVQYNYSFKALYKKKSKSKT